MLTSGPFHLAAWMSQVVEILGEMGGPDAQLLADSKRPEFHIEFYNGTKASEAARSMLAAQGRTTWPRQQMKRNRR